MNKIIFTFALTTLIAGTTLTSCMSSHKKLENAQNNMQDTKDNIVKAKLELNQKKNDSIQQF